MPKAKVYFTNLRTKPGNNLLDKLRKLIRKAGLEKIDFKEKFVAVKIHFGEPGNLAYIRPNYTSVVVNLIRKAGGRPFLTDTNTLYTGKRANAVDHLESAMRNGFNPMTTDAQVIIADGLKGTEFKEIPVDLKYCETAKIASVIADADIFVSMNHFKGHEITGFGGALKNIGMGSASRGGKLEMHSASKPKMVKERCTSCGMCIKWCPQQAIAYDHSRKAEIDYEKCIGCGQCVAVCQSDAAQVVWNEAGDICAKKIVEYAYAVLKDKPHFHINFIMNVSPDCDCGSNNDLPIVPDIGIAASWDPVALDLASVDLVNKSAMVKGSLLEERGYIRGRDKFTTIHSQTDWRVAMEYAVAIGLGKGEYEWEELA